MAIGITALYFSLTIQNAELLFEAKKIALREFIRLLEIRLNVTNPFGMWTYFRSHYPIDFYFGAKNHPV